MITLQVIDRDIAISNHSFKVLDNSNTLKQRIAHSLALYLGEFNMEPTLGLDWFSLKEFKYNTDEIVKAVRSVLLKDPEVISINSLEVIYIDTPEKVQQYNKPKRTVIINWNLNTIFGSLSL